MKKIVLAIIFSVTSACSADKPLEDFVAEDIETKDVHSTQQEVDTSPSYTERNSVVQGDTRLSIRGQDFFQALLSLNESLMEEGRMHVQIPSIWVFSPQGELARMVLENNALETFSMEFSTIDPQAQSITCQQIDASVVEAIGREWSMGCTDDRWTALLLTGNSSECEESCPKYENVTMQAEEENQDLLQIRTLVLNF